MSALQTFSEKVTTRIAGPAPSSAVTTSAGVGAPDWTALLEQIMQLVMSLLADCSMSDTKVVAAARKPNILQRARFKSQVYRELRSSGTSRWRSEAASVCSGILDEAAEASEEELLDVVFETSNDDWLLI